MNYYKQPGGKCGFENILTLEMELERFGCALLRLPPQPARDFGAGTAGQGGTFGVFSYAYDLDMKLLSDIKNGVIGNETSPWPAVPKVSQISHPSAQVMIFEQAFLIQIRKPILRALHVMASSLPERWSAFSHNVITKAVPSHF